MDVTSVDDPRRPHASQQLGQYSGCARPCPRHLEFAWQTRQLQFSRCATVYNVSAAILRFLSTLYRRSKTTGRTLVVSSCYGSDQRNAYLTQDWARRRYIKRVMVHGPSLLCINRSAASLYHGQRLDSNWYISLPARQVSSSISKFQA
jgi:hypothetical protein